MGGTNPRGRTRSRHAGGSNPSEEEGGDAPAPWRLCRAPASPPTLPGPAGFNLTNGGLPFTENHSGCCQRVMPGPWPTATAGPTPAPHRLQRDLSPGASCSPRRTPWGLSAPLPRGRSYEDAGCALPSGPAPAHLQSVLGQRPWRNQLAPAAGGSAFPTLSWLHSAVNGHDCMTLDGHLPCRAPRPLSTPR